MIRGRSQGGESRSPRLRGVRLGSGAAAVLLCLLCSAVAAGGTQPYETYESTVAADGPVAQFRFDDAVGSSTIVDSVGSYTAINNGVVLGGEGPFGGGRSGAFGGAAYGSLPGDPLAGANEFTFEGWVDWSGEMVFKEPIFEFGASSTNYMYLTPASTPGNHKMLFEIHTSGGSSAEVTATKLAVNVWKDVAVSETSAGTLTLYVNGEQVGQVTGASVFPSSLGSAPSNYLGKSLVAGEPLFKGSLSNVAFYTKALSATRIREHYDAGEFPVNTVAPTISGTAKDGSTLTATKAGTWTGVTPITLAYQWTRCDAAGESCANIPAASETKYKLSHEDVGSTLRVAVTASNSAGTGSASSAQSALVAPLAPSNTVPPAISGAAEQGQLLSVSEGSWSGTPPLSYAYQWQSCNSTGGSCKKITGASASTYRVLGSQIGGTLRAMVTAENAAGSKTATSETTAVITTGPPADTALPVVSGTAEDGHTLSASTGSWAGTEPFSYTYQWELCNNSGESCANISGATASTYALGPSDVGDTLRVVVTAKNSVGSTGATSAASGVVAAIPPSNTSAPTITGSDVDGQTLTAGTGSWSGSPPLSYAYQWELCNGSGESCTNISGATSSTYLLGHGDVGGTLRVKVTASNTGGSASSTSAATGVVAALAPSSTSLPSISGTAREGQTLNASTGSWEGTPPITYTYQWQTCNSTGEDCANVSGATNSTYALEHSDVGDTMRVVVRASNAGGSTPATSAATGVVTAFAPSNTAAPSISGTAEEGQTLSASTGTWEGAPPISYTYQWESCNGLGEDCFDIAEATESTLALGSEEVGETVRVVVTAMNSAGSASASSAASKVVVEATPPSNISVPVVSGSATEGGTLSATTGSWEGSQPLAYSYQWESCNPSGEDCAGIEGASSSTYQPDPAAVGHTLRVRVIASNVVGVASAVSAASSTVGASVTLPVNLVAPEVSGSAQVGGSLVAHPGTWTGAPPLAYSYQWESCNSAGESCTDVAGASESTYRLVAGEVGGTVRVVVTASNGDGHASRISPASAMVKEGVSSSGPPCTDTWVGPSEGEWQDGADWSKGSAPTASDVACVGSGTTVEISDGTYHVGVLHDEGTLEVFGSAFEHPRTSLEITGTSEVSTVGTLSLYGVLTGPGSVDVSGALEWNEGGEMTGSGRTVIEPGVSGTFDGGSLAGRTLVNEGTVTFSQDYLEMAEGALLENRGVFKDNSEACAKGCGLAGQILVASSNSGAAPEVLNTGTFEKTQGSGTSTVAVYFTNDGTVSASSGTLEFTGGGIPGQASTGVWNVETGASIKLAGGVYAVGETVSLLAVHVEKGASVERVPAPGSSSAPSISGTPQAGQTLTASAGSWLGSEPISFAYQWESCNASGGGCEPIAGASSQSYTVLSGEIGATVRVVVTASNSHGQALAASPASSVIQAPAPPSNTGLPTVSGAAQDGQTLTASTGEWDGVAPVSYTYQWESCNPAGEECAAIENATGAKYALTEGDIGSTLRVIVTATNPGGSTKATSQASTVVQAEPPSELQAPSITGTPDVHDVLYAAPGVWTGTTTEFSYQWESCNESGSECAPVEGATGPEYDLTEGDLSRALRVRVGVHSAADSLSDLSPATPVIGAAGALAGTQAPTISGAPQAGQALTAKPGAWSGGAGSISYAYQWQSCEVLGAECHRIEGATSPSYVPTSGEVGQRLRVQVTATDEQGHRVSQATEPVAQTQAPVAEQAPPITGPALAGQTLTVGTGVFAGEGPLSYAYQWERCEPAGSCNAIEGATQSSYTLTEPDVGSTVLVLVSATDSGGSTTAVSAPTAVVGPEALSEFSPPSISGVVAFGGTLSADPGIWSATGPVTYAYQWESCNSSGEDCTPIAEAQEPTYTPGIGDLGVTLRVTVTASSPQGSKNAVSAYTVPTWGGEASVEEAQAIAQQTDPAVLAPSSTAALEEQSISPALAESGEELAAQSTLTSSTISKETAGEFAVNTPAGELSLAPVESQPAAVTPATIVNGAAALFADTWPATDMIIRPQPLGATALLQLRSAEAPRSFSWAVRLGPDQELKQLPDGSIAAVEASEESAQPASGQTGEAGPLRRTTPGPPETSEEKAEAEQEESQPQTEEEVPLESLPASPHSSTAPGEAGAGQPQPQQTQASYEAAKNAMTSAETQTAGKALVVIAPPNVTDAEGHIVPATLTVAGDTFTLTLKPGTGAVYPLLADTMIAAPSNKTSAARDPVKYGLSDSLSKEEGHIGEGHLDEHFEENGTPTAGFDPNLEKGPLHVKTARLIIPYDVATASGPYATAEMHRLETWLEKVGKAHLQPFITLGKDEAIDPCGEGGTPCPLPSVGEYKKSVERLMKDLIAGNATKGFPPVELWGAWNEPDIRSSPLRHHEVIAAHFWEVAQSILAKLAKRHPCPNCAVVAGEFAFSSGYEYHYTSAYKSAILCHPKKSNHCKRYWGGLPAAWGFHDYYDVIERQGSAASKFTAFTGERLGKPRIFMSEAGVELQNGQEAVLVSDGSEKVELKTHPELQAQAAEHFLNLHKGLSRVDREYYYMYTAPTKKEVERSEAEVKHKVYLFDSALLEVESGHRRERPAYCVLAYEKQMCPPTAEAESTGVSVGHNACVVQPTTVQVTGHVVPNGAKAFSYHFEYGPTAAYGQSTIPQSLEVENGWTPVEVHAEIPVTAYEETSHGRCPSPIHFRLVAENAQGQRNGSDQEITFVVAI